jgi:hypothetical protein
VEESFVPHRNAGIPHDGTVGTRNHLP